MARGAQSKSDIMNILLKIFPTSFMNGEKELRIGCTENGEKVEIKVSLTASKDIVGQENGTRDVDSAPISETMINIAPTYAPPSEEEQENLRKLIEALNI